MEMWWEYLRVNKIKILSTHSNVGILCRKEQTNSLFYIRCARAAKLLSDIFNPFMPTVPTFAVRETASLGIMGAPRVPPLNPSETIVLSEHYRL